MNATKEIKQLKEEIEAIKARNRRVEADKAWETSLIRRIFVAISTYVLVLILFLVIGVDRPLETATVPAIAYLISTVSLSMLKSWWLRKRERH